MSGRPMSATIDEYVSRYPDETRAALESLRLLVREVAPDATETIAYAIPTFDLDGTHLVHFAGFDRHVGFYPTPSGIEAFKDELAGYKTAKGSVQFPLGKPLPLDLLRRIVQFRVREVRGA